MSALCPQPSHCRRKIFTPRHAIRSRSANVRFRPQSTKSGQSGYDPLADGPVRGDCADMSRQIPTYEFIDGAFVVGSDPIVCVVPLAMLDDDRRNRRGVQRSCILPTGTLDETICRRVGAKELPASPTFPARARCGCSDPPRTSSAPWPSQLQDGRNAKTSSIIGCWERQLTTPKEPIRLVLERLDCGPRL